jgi:sugar (pentulose or hexulose) kinase
MRHAAVLVIHRDLARLALIDMLTFREIKALERKVAWREGPPYRHVDTEALWTFLLRGLKDYQRFYDVEAIAVTGEGGMAALIDEGGELALPVLDPADPGPESLAHYYDALRPDERDSGAPRRAAGGNLGAQLFWQMKTLAADWSRVTRILTWPQYWAFRLSGTAVSEVTALSAASDLWLPGNRTFSPMVDRLGWRGLLPPLAWGDARLGPVLPAIRTATGLGEEAGVWCGVTLRAAELIAEGHGLTGPFTVIETGAEARITAVSGGPSAVPKECGLRGEVLAVLPMPVFSAYGELLAGRALGASLAELDGVLANGIRLRRAGDGRFRWSADPAGLSDGAAYAAATLFLARETAVGLAMSGAAGPILVEGPMTDNGFFLDALAILAAVPLRSGTGNLAGAAVGAALLADRPGRVARTPVHRPAVEVLARAGAIRDACRS